MKKNLYFRHHYARKNVLMEFVSELFLKLSSYPRLIIEVIIRRRFGQRYFSMATAITVGLILAILPLVGAFKQGGFFAGTVDACAWYLFLVMFMGYSVKHWWETIHYPGTFDFARFSKYSGDIHPMFGKINFWNWQPDVRVIETLLEPGLFFLIGLLLHLVGFSLGMLLIVVSIIYGWSYWAAYKRGDDFTLNLIDEMIMNEEMENAYVLNKPTDQTRGVRFHATKPKIYTMRQKLAESFIEDTSKVEFTLAE